MFMSFEAWAHGKIKSEQRKEKEQSRREREGMFWGKQGG